MQSTTDTDQVEDLASVTEDPEQPLTVDERRAQARSVAGPLDRALMDRPIGSPRSYEPRLRTGEQLTHPSIALNGDLIEKLEGYDVHGMLVSEAADALRAMHATVESVISAREKAKKDPTLGTEAAQILKLAEYVDRLWAAASVKGDTARKTLEQRIAQAETDLRAKIETGTGYLNAQASEIRAFAKSLNSAERAKWIAALIEKNDTESLAAVLRGKAYLSGPTDEMGDTYTKLYNQRQKPALMAQLKLMTKALELLDRGHRLYVNEQIEGAMGVKHALVQRLRAERAAAAF